MGWQDAPIVKEGAWKDAPLVEPSESTLFGDKVSDQSLSDLVTGRRSPSMSQKVGAIARAGWEGFTGPARLAEQVIGKMGIPVLSDAAAASAEERGEAVRQAKQVSPVGATVANIGGSIVSPTSVATMGTFPIARGASILKSAAQGAGQGGLFALLQPVEDAGNMLAEKGRQLLWGSGGGAVGGAVAGKASQVAANRTAAKAARQVQDAAGRSAREAGYTIPPATTNPTVTNRALEGFAGKLTTAQQSSIKNQSVTNALVRKALGMADDAPITKEALETLGKNHGAAYEAVKRVPGTFVADDAFNAAVANIEQKATGMASEFPSLVNKDVTPLIDDLMRGEWSPQYAVEATKRLREAARNTLSSPAATNEAKQLAAAQKDAAKALEDLIARNLEKAGMKDLHGAWQTARREIAKVKNVEKALNDATGNVVAGKLGKQLEKGAPLSGELETVARAANAFPKATRELTKESMPGVSPLDYWSSLGLAGLTQNPLALGLPAARMGLRSLVLSPAYQRIAGTPTYSTRIAGLLTQAHPAIPAAAGSLLLAD